MDYQPKINSEGGAIPPTRDAAVSEGVAATKYEEVAQIEIRGVRFAYPTKKDVHVLKGLNLEVQKNKVVALVGQSGKSRIIQ